MPLSNRKVNPLFGALNPDHLFYFLDSKVRRRII